MKKLLMIFAFLSVLSQSALALTQTYCESDLDGHSAEHGDSGGFHDGGFLVMDGMEGYCINGSNVFRFSSFGFGASLRIGSFQYMSLTCLNEDIAGEYMGVSLSVGAVLNINGATFAKAGFSNICDLSGLGNGLGAHVTVDKILLEKVDCNDQKNYDNIRFCRR